MDDLIEALAFYEKRPGSGIWYQNGEGTNSYSPRVCENPECSRLGEPFMGLRHGGGQRFCSKACAGWRRDVAYGGRHQRVHSSRGPASSFLCVDCGEAASDRAQTHGTDGTKPEHYAPRCRPCHAVYDSETKARGERHGRSRLTDTRVRDIRASAAAGGCRHELASLHGVSKSTIDRVLRHATWSHVN